MENQLRLIRVFSLIYFIGAAVLGVDFALSYARREQFSAAAPLPAIPPIYWLATIMAFVGCIVTGIGLYKLKRWGWTWAVLTLFLWSFVFGAGTLIMAIGVAVGSFGPVFWRDLQPEFLTDKLALALGVKWDASAFVKIETLLREHKRREAEEIYRQILGTTDTEARAGISAWAINAFQRKLQFLARHTEAIRSQSALI